MSTKAIIAALVGGVLMYVWASAVHMSPLAMTGVSQMADEGPALAALKTATGDKAGLYMYPAMGHDMSAQAMKAMEAKLGTGPHGLVIYHPAKPGMPMLSPTQLIGEFLLELVETFIAVWLLTLTNITSFGGRVGFFVVVGVLAAVTTNGSYWLWYGYPGSYTIANMAIEVGKFLFAGLGVAFVLGRRSGAQNAAQAAA